MGEEEERRRAGFAELTEWERAGSMAEEIRAQRRINERKAKSLARTGAREVAEAVFRDRSLASRADVQVALFEILSDAYTKFLNIQTETFAKWVDERMEPAIQEEVSRRMMALEAVVDARLRPDQGIHNRHWDLLLYKSGMDRDGGERTLEEAAEMAGVSLSWATSCLSDLRVPGSQFEGCRNVNDMVTRAKASGWLTDHLAALLTQQTGVQMRMAQLVGDPIVAVDDEDMEAWVLAQQRARGTDANSQMAREAPKTPGNPQ